MEKEERVVCGEGVNSVALPPEVLHRGVTARVA